tara:strand:+ start:40468 stop:41733 length:1266 start_codon:yes stop_codon:yes gene_type:complete
MTIRIINGKRLRTDFTWQDSQSIDILDGRIASLDAEAHDAGKVIDAQGCLILPGLIDLNVSLREPGYTSKGSVLSETKAAVAGGVTQLCCSPQTSPVNDSRAVTKLIKELASSAGYCDVFPLGALTRGLKGEQLSEYAALKSAQCIALSNAYNPIKNLAITKRCFDYAQTHGMSVFVNPIEASLHKGAMHEGHVSTTIGLQGIPAVAETIAVSQLIQLACASGVHLHLSQLSAKGSVEQLRIAKQSGAKVTADVAIQNLLYTDDMTEAFSSIYHCLPPLREDSDRQALIAGIIDGTIDAITSAHQPHEAEAKQMPFAETDPGMSTIEFLLPMAQILSQRNELDLALFIKAMTQGAASVLNFPSMPLEEGSVASLVIYDANKECQVTNEMIISKGKNTPLLGKYIVGQVKATISKGRLVFEG